MVMMKIICIEDNGVDIKSDDNHDIYSDDSLLFFI